MRLQTCLSRKMMALLAEIAKSKEEDNGVAEGEQFGVICFHSSAANSMLVVYKLLPPESVDRFIITTYLII